MTVDQAFQILAQTADLAVAEGVFKSTRDAAIIEQAKQILQKHLEGCKACEATDEAE